VSGHAVAKDKVPACVWDALGDAVPTRLPLYSKAISDAWRDVAPVFGQASYSDIFRSLASNPEWLATSLLFNAQSEMTGSSILGKMAEELTGSSLGLKLQAHAADEERHGRWYVMIVELVFPGAMSDELRDALKNSHYASNSTFQFQPMDWTADKQHTAIDEISQINLVEIRTLLHQMLQRPFLEAFSDSRNTNKLKKLTDALLSDEGRHIRYTAALLEDFGATNGQDALTGLVTQRLRDLDVLTRAELAAAQFG
jgi:hypothetical protein